ncbi:MAG: VOC family protein [Acidimicrobiia bacterium]
MATRFQVTFDCADPELLAAFWAGALGYILQPPPQGYDAWEDWLREMGIPEEEWSSRAAAVDPEGVGPRLWFQMVPEGKTAKNRVHLDLNVATAGQPEARPMLVDAEVERLVGLGALRLRATEELGAYWVVMEDPEGNEFCVQ